MRAGDIVWINNKIPATIIRFTTGSRVVVKFGAACRLTTNTSDISKENGKLILHSSIFKF